MNELNAYIGIDNGIRFGKPCIKGTRIAVGDILQWLSSGMTYREIMEDYPELEKAHINAALAFAAEREHMVNEIIRIAKISAENFYYIEKNAKNFHVGKNEIGGRCGDYALDFVIRWNNNYTTNEAEIVAVNQELCIQSGSYKIAREISVSNLIRYKQRNESGWLRNVPQGDGLYIDLVLYHPCLGFYEVKQTKAYEVKTHFGQDMTKKGSHVWARIGDIAIDPCWADTDNTSFIGEDVIIS